MTSEFWSAIVGAVVGGLIALGIQMIVLRDTRTDRKNQADERKEATAYSLFAKLQSCSRDLQQFSLHIQEAQWKAKQRGWELWSAMIPIPNLPRHQEITNDELTMLIRARKFDLFNLVRDVEATHHTSILAFQLYLERRTEFGRLTGASMNGNVGTTSLSQNQLNELGPLMADLRGLADSMAAHAGEYATSSVVTLKDYNDALKEIIGKRFELDFSRMERGEAALAAMMNTTTSTAP